MVPLNILKDRFKTEDRDSALYYRLENTLILCRMNRQSKKI